MKKLIFLAALFVALYATSCGDKNPPEPQEPEKQYSTWIVNGTDTFSTNNVGFMADCNPDHSYCRAVLDSHGPNRFSLAFALDYFPTSGNYVVLYHSGSGEITCAIKIYYNNKYYYHSSPTPDSVYTSIVNNKIRYTLPPARFVFYEDPDNDSIMVQGVFSEP